jgi:hypothetical protein
MATFNDADFVRKNSANTVTPFNIAGFKVKVPGEPESGTDAAFAALAKEQGVKALKVSKPKVETAGGIVGSTSCEMTGIAISSWIEQRTAALLSDAPPAEENKDKTPSETEAAPRNRVNGKVRA